MNLRVRRVTGVSASAILSDCRDGGISRNLVDGEGEDEVDGDTERLSRELGGHTAIQIARFLVVLRFAGAAWSVHHSRSNF